jgi:hypothetical protein
VNRRDENWDPAYTPEADDPGELWCPACGAVIYADAVRCPACEQYVTPGRPPAPAWKRILAVVLILLALSYLAAALFGQVRPGGPTSIP